MLLLHEGQTDIIVVTLQEKTTLVRPNYLFVCSHLVESVTVSFVKQPTEDQSNYPNRYNQYEIDTASLFAGKPVGQYLYKVYEQTGLGTDPAGLNEVESGKLNYLPAAGMPTATYTPTITKKAYGG